MRSPFSRRQETVRSASTVTMAAPTLVIMVAATASGVAAGGTLHGAVPEPVTASAPGAGFSSARALEHVRVVAREPHPMGSPANAAVRDNLVGELRADPRHDVPGSPAEVMPIAADPASIEQDSSTVVSKSYSFVTP